MTVCTRCGGMLTVADSGLRTGEPMLECKPCGRPIRLLIKSQSRPMRKGDRNRMLRAARRMQLRGLL